MEKQISNEQLFAKLDEVQTLLTGNRFLGIDEKSVELWSIEDIAAYSKFSTRTVQAWISAPYFPKPVLVPSQRNPRKNSDKPRWFAGEIVRFMKRRQM